MVGTVSGDLRWSYSYEPFGTMRTEKKSSNMAPTNPMRFTGEYMDLDTSLYDLRARMYDPGTGRFLQLDPLAQSPVVPYTGSYVYANDRPTVFTDPSGRCFIGLFGEHCDNPIHTAVQKVVQIGKVVYKGVKGCLRGLPYGLFVGGLIGEAAGNPLVGAAVVGAGACIVGAAVEINNPGPPGTEPFPPFEGESLVGSSSISAVGYEEK